MDARSQNRVFKKPLYIKNPKNLYIKSVYVLRDHQWRKIFFPKMYYLLKKVLLNLSWVLVKFYQWPL